MEFFEQKRGVCQDFTHLMISCLRSTGLAARYVSGYLLTRPAPGKPHRIGADVSHAWVSLFVPGIGWIDFDPTNSIVGNRNLIRVAVAWAPEHVLPLWGTYEGSPGAFIGMDVTVAVTEEAG